jgi:hypothetical protein
MASAAEPWYTRSLQLVLVTSWAFVFIHGMARDGASVIENPPIVFMYFLKWCLLAAVTVPPIAGVVLLIDRTARGVQRAIDEGSDERR